MHQGAAAAGHDSFLDRSAGGVEGVFDAQLAVAQLSFSGGTHLDHGYATGQLGYTLGELLAVVLRIGVVEFALDRGNPITHGSLVVTAGHDRGVVFADGDPAHAAKILEAHLVEGHGLVLAHHGGAGEDRDVLQHGLAAIAEARSAHGGNLKHAAVLVHHQGGEGLTVDFLRQDHQRLASA